MTSPMRRALLWLSLSPLAALAANAPATKMQPLPDEPPPQVQIDPDMEPEVTIVKKGDVTEEQYRIRGKLYMIKVTPKSGPPYYLVDERGAGTFIRRDALDPGLVVPRWVILQW